jgi:hypothetical protein
VDIPPTNADGFMLRPEAGSIGQSADYPLSLWERLGVRA